MVFPLIPRPAAVAFADGALTVTDRTRVVIADGTDAAAAADLADTVAARTGIRPRVVAAEAADGDIVITGRDAADEAYRLRIGARAELTGSPAGLFYGIRTLAQLLTETEGSWSLPRSEIDDAPRYAYRGIMLDVARTFYPVSTITAVIDRIASLKFNRLHLHLTDDQGWRLEIASRPELTALAASTSALGRPGGFYTADDYRAIVRYAAERHVVIVPEIDLPGHTHAIGVAYPDLVEEPALTADHAQQAEDLGQRLPEHGRPYGGWAVGHSSVRIHHEPTWDLLRDVLTEVAALSPGPYLHIGGDEALGTAPADFDSFIARVTALTADLGKTPMAWHEAGSAAVAPGTIGQFWGSSTPTPEHAAHTRAFAERGGFVVLSPSDTAYLDQKYDADTPLGLTWAGHIDVRTAYDWEPEQIVPALPAAAILGIEGPLWSETLSDLADIDQLLLPRAAALAEIAWSPAAAKDWESFRARLGALGAHWDAAGWGGHRSAEIEWVRG